MQFRHMDNNECLTNSTSNNYAHINATRCPVTIRCCPISLGGIVALSRNKTNTMTAEEFIYFVAIALAVLGAGWIQFRP